jgi:hypothetical protein
MRMNLKEDRSHNSRSSMVHRRTTKTRPLVQGRGARSRCHPGLPVPHGPGLNGLRRPSLVTGGAGWDLPPTRRVSETARFHRPGSAPQLRSVFPRRRRRHSQRLPLSGLRSRPRTISITAFGKMSECGGEDTTARAIRQDRFLIKRRTGSPSASTFGCNEKARSASPERMLRCGPELASVLAISWTVPTVRPR